MKRPPGSGAAGIQVDSGQVKNLNFLFEELEINLQYRNVIFFYVVYIFEEKNKIGLQV